jgi:stage V sporulation protein D (sporulation-specific penicillin-binding protein)
LKKPKIKRFNLRMKRKLVIVFAVITLALIALIGRLTYINAKSGSKYAQTVLSQQTYSSTTLPYKRGDIVDRNGTVLATSTRVYNVILDSKVLNEDQDAIEPTVSALVECFPELSADEIKTFISENPNNQYHILLKKQSYETVQPFIEKQNDTENNPNIAGVWFESQYIRQYPYNTLASSLLGFTTNDTGSAGIESYYNEELSGVDGREYGYLNSDSNVETTVVSPVDGNTVVSTIDANIQSVVEEKVAAFNKKHANAYREGEDGSKNTSVIVMNPNNGEILAMCTYPNYDPNNPRDLSTVYSEETISSMTDEEKSDALNSLWENFAVTNTFEPGSTAKTFTIAAGLETGVLTGDETWYCDGSETIDGNTIHCSHTHGHGTLTTGQALAQSCNDALMQMAMKMGKETFCEYQNVFNLGLRTNIDLPSEARTDSLIYTVDNMDDTALATNSFGQNFNSTMIQIAAAFSSAINGGNYYWPHVVSEIRNSDGDTVKTIDPVLMKSTVSEETSSLLRQYLNLTVTEGTATDLQIPGYSLGGKTGTAEKIPRKDGNYLVSFIGFAPVEDPQVVVYVVIDELNDANQAQSNYAVSLTREIMSEILPYLNIYPDHEATDSENEVQTTVDAQNEYEESTSLLSDEASADEAAAAEAQSAQEASDAANTEEQ